VPGSAPPIRLSGPCLRTARIAAVTFCGARYARAHNLFDLEFKPFAPVLRPGQCLGFDLRANPVISVPAKPGERGKRHDVVMHLLSKVARDERAAARETAIRDAGTAWLARKGTTAGFRVDPSRLHIDGYDRVRIPRSDARAVIFSTLTFQGVLTVEDPAQFLAAVLRGFGAAKGFGCGLMLIRRARL
jgi:CRISPR system Cascade subunit CasE